MIRHEDVLRQAMTEAIALFEDGVSKESKADRIGHLVAALNVYTDANYTEEEQSRLFEVSAQRLRELKK